MNIFVKKGFRWFLAGFGAGVAATIGVVLCAALIDLHLHSDKLWAGQFGDYSVQINEQPGEFFERSFDVFVNDRPLARFGNRPSPDKPNFVHIYPTDNITVEMLLDRMDGASPAMLVHNGDDIITKVMFGHENVSSPKAYYGRYRDTDRLNPGDTGYIDLDFDGRFDVMDRFGTGTTVDQTFILLNGTWQPAVECHDVAGTAIVVDSQGRRVSCRFVSGEGWRKSAGE